MASRIVYPFNMWRLCPRGDAHSWSLLVASSRCCSSSSGPPTTSGGTVRVYIERGLPHFQVPLPSRREVCLFTLKPLTHTAGDLCRFISMEDKGIDRVALYTKDHVRISQSNTIDTLLSQGFSVAINDKLYDVQAPSYGLESEETMDRLGDVKNLINQLYSNLNIEEYQIKQERQLKAKLDNINLELAPLEKNRVALGEKAARHTRISTWMGLGAMGLQFGVLARLTWWEYSWDIMEPVTYFVGYGTSMVMFAYYVVTRQEYCFPQVFDRLYLKKFYQSADKTNFDVDRYNELREELAQVQSDLKRLRDPLLLNLPLQQTKDLLEASFNTQSSLSPHSTSTPPSSK